MLDPNDLKTDLVNAIVSSNANLTTDQVNKLVDVFEKMSIAITNQIKRGRVTVSGNGTFDVE